MRLRQLYESSRVAVTAFGRFNPPTIGHAKLAEKIRSFGGDHYIFLSHRNDSEDNPLDFKTKQYFMKNAFPDITIGNKSVKTLFQMMDYLHIMGYTDVILVTGGDRVEDFKESLRDYTGFNSIKIANAGDRDSKANDITGVEASDARQYVIDGDFARFQKIVPFETHVARKLFQKLKQRLTPGEHHG